MVEIVYRSPKQLIILECTRYPSLDDLAKTIAVLIRTGNMKCSNGLKALLSPTQTYRQQPKA